MNIKIFLLASVFVFLMSSCSTCTTNNSVKEKTEKEPMAILKEIAIEKLGPKFNVIENESQSYAIIVESDFNKNSPIVNKTRFFVFNIESQKVIYENNVTNGKIFWESDTELRVGRIPGIIKKDEEGPGVIGGYSYNVITGEKKYK